MLSRLAVVLRVTRSVQNAAVLQQVASNDVEDQARAKRAHAHAFAESRP